MIYALLIVIFIILLAYGVERDGWHNLSIVFAFLETVLLPITVGWCIYNITKEFRKGARWI